MLITDEIRKRRFIFHRDLKRINERMSTKKYTPFKIEKTDKAIDWMGEL